MACGPDCPALILQLVVYGVTNGAVVALNAVGFTLAYAVARQLNLAHGNVFALTTVAVAYLARLVGVTVADPLWLRIGLVAVLALVGALIGAGLNGAVERLAFRPFGRGRDPLGPLIASVGLAFAMLQVAIWWHAATSVPQPGHQGVALPLLAMPDVLPRVELGYAAFFAIGGYTVAILTASGSRFAAGLPDVAREPWLALVGAGLVTARFGFIFGLPGGAICAGLHGHLEPEQFDVTLSLMVLAAVVIGGRWGLGGVVLGALVVAAYDRVLVDVLTAGVRSIGGVVGSEGRRRAHPRDDNFAVFGIALYLATVWRARR